MDLQTSVEINAPVERIWEVLMDVERWPEWSDSMQSIRKLDAGELRPGSRAAIVQPRTPKMTWTVTQIEAGRSFAWEASGRGLKTRAGHTIEPGQPGSRVVLSLHQSGPTATVLGWYIKKLASKYIDIEARGLKRRCESGL